MIKVITRIDTDLIVVKGECHLGIEHGMDRTTEEGDNILIIYRNDFMRGLFREIQNYRVTIIEVDVETTIEMTFLEEVEVGLGKDSILVTLEGLIKAAVDQDQVQQPVLTEIGLDVLNVGNMIISLMTVKTQEMERESEQL